MTRDSFAYKPGHRSRAVETSLASAKDQEAKAPTMLAAVLAEMGDGLAYSCEELTERILATGRKTLLTSVRARVCQLHKQGLVVDSGLRGVGESGTARVVKWRRSTSVEHARIVAEREASTAGHAREKAA